MGLPLSEAHHAAHVLRLKAGAAVELFDGCGTAATARIVEVRKGKVTAEIESVRPATPRPLPLVHLAFATPKGNRLDWLLEKATELGVASLHPLRLERSVAGVEDFSTGKRDRWLGHCISAAKQADLDWLPELHSPAPLSALVNGAGGAAGLFGDLAPDAVPPARAIGDLQRPAALYVVIGPEGGLAENERQALRAAGFAGVRLGHTILRIETAAVALVAGILALYDQES
jgi:16S rRNA (uracil1498-N3)-methyltransferase